jgi:hypothetical protein
MQDHTIAPSRLTNAESWQLPISPRSASTEAVYHGDTLWSNDTNEPARASRDRTFTRCEQAIGGPPRYEVPLEPAEDGGRSARCALPFVVQPSGVVVRFAGTFVLVTSAVSLASSAPNCAPMARELACTNG